ncbi:PREDICTED: 5-hydroxytryptamine receptor 3A-like [Nanorana parkeri]|uniref:5-hydroxytryptamine receptor 3A-like n=1 Tax=Nanorana parkeri TaxID=125878 RepID=UPI00085433C9|nr:PREDICTED: 5-hydroxytryptamine receptor 3A-like [Nanorana parkeri]
MSISLLCAIIWNIIFYAPSESAELQCSGSEAGPSYESLQSVFDKKSFRPTLNYSRPTSVNISFTIYAVLGVNEKTQILTTFLWLRMFWQHEFLTWTPANCGAVEKISLPVEDIWTPDIIVYEFIDEDKSQRTPFVYVNHTGRVRYDKMIRVVSSCNLGIFNFPFDVQNCSLTFGSYMHTVRDVRLGLALPVEQILQNSLQYLETSGEWELLRIEGSPDILRFGIDEWDIITFWVVVRRRPILYVVNLLIPSAFLMLIDILSFFLPPHSTDRASFKMTLLLGYTVFLLIMNDLLPSTANGTPLIGIYFSVCLALLVLSLLETVIITHVLHRGTQSGIVPCWVKRFVLGFLAQLVCYNDVSVSDENPITNNHTLYPTNDIDAPRQAPPSPCHDNGTNTEHKEFSPPVFEFLSPETLCSGAERLLALISQNLRMVREMLESRQHFKAQEEEWVKIGYVLDSLLYRLYLIFIGSYAIIIISVWCVWYNT